MKKWAFAAEKMEATKVAVNAELYIFDEICTVLLGVVKKMLVDSGWRKVLYNSYDNDFVQFAKERE